MKTIIFTMATVLTLVSEAEARGCSRNGCNSDGQALMVAIPFLLVCFLVFAVCSRAKDEAKTRQGRSGSKQDKVPTSMFRDTRSNK